MTTAWLVLEDQAAGQIQPEVTASMVHLLHVTRPTPPRGGGVQSKKDNDFHAQSPEKLVQLRGKDQETPSASSASLATQEQGFIVST